MKDRYSRQISLDEIGPNGQAKLAKARVLVVGAGGLGSPVLMYLAAAGTGHIGIADDDRVSLSNLQRQILYSENDIGKTKVSVAAQRLSAMNGDLDVKAMSSRIDKENINNILNGYDVVIDCCDNYPTRALVEGHCHSLGIPYIYGAIQGFQGQVTIFNDTTLRYKDLFPSEMENASDSVIGMTAGIVGCTQAHEAVKLICGYGEPLINKLWTIDLRSMQSHIIDLL